MAGGQAAWGDFNNDGLPDLFPVGEGAPPYDEAAYGADPLDPDTDGDGLTDSVDSCVLEPEDADGDAS